jgi:peptidoglycan/LPS O-acetylase OafA/YrhL
MPGSETSSASLLLLKANRVSAIVFSTAIENEQDRNMFQWVSLNVSKSASLSPVSKFDYIDALRGIAVLLVVLAHTPVPSRAVVLNQIGSYGVQLFFIVSAFTLFLSLASRASRDTRPVLFFFIRRVFRIAPAFYLAAALYLMKDGLGASAWAPDGIHGWQIVATLLFLHGWHPLSINAVVPGGWSIAVEMNFYLFVPLCFLLVTNVYRAFGLAVALGALGVVLDRLALPTLLGDYVQQPTLFEWFPLLWFPAQACVFPIGFALYFLFDKQSGKMSAEPKTVMLVCCGAVATVILWKVHLAQALLPAAFGIGVFAYFVAVYKPKLVVNPMTRYVGKISFSVYLSHFWMIALVREHLVPLWQDADPYFAAACFYISVLTLTCAVASLTYRFFEVPGQALGAALINYIKGKIRSAQEI